MWSPAARIIEPQSIFWLDPHTVLFAIGPDRLRQTAMLRADPSVTLALSDTVLSYVQVVI